MLSKPVKFSDKFIKRCALRCFVVLLCAFFGVTNGAAKSYTAFIETDLDGDGKTERIELNSERDATLQIRRGGKLLWQGVPGRWNPWKLEITDVDGDGRREIIVGVFKATKFFPKAHNCLFIYGFTDDRAFPKWLGSTLGRPFTDFTFADLSGEAGDELVALETTLEGKKSLAIYRWNNFGFTLDWQRGNWQTAKISGVQNGRISVEADGRQIFLAKDKTR
jgi:hypothetical protein